MEVMKIDCDAVLVYLMHSVKLIMSYTNPLLGY